MVYYTYRPEFTKFGKGKDVLPMNATPASAKKPRIHPAWLILVGCILYQGGTTGVLNNCLGVFYTAICTDLGFRNGDLSMYTTIRSIVISLAMPFTLKLLKKYPLKAVLTVEMTGASLCFAMMAFFDKLIYWYISAVFLGLFASSLFAVPVTLVINNWFKKKNGFAVGLSLAASGLFGAVMNPICSKMILALGWRQAVLWTAGIAMALTVPAILFILRLTPEEVGYAPYGAEEGLPGDLKKNVPEGTPVYRNPGLVLLLCILVCSCALWTCQYYSHMARYAQSVGYDLTVSALVTSCAMVGNIIGKVALGAIADKWNIWRTARLSMAIVGAAFVILIVGGQNINRYVMYLASCLSGVSMAAGTLIPNLLSLDVYKAAGYQEKYGLITAIGTFISAIGFAVIGYTFDFTGSYTLSFVISAGAVVLFFILLSVLQKMTKGASSPETLAQEESALEELEEEMAEG